MPYILSTRRRCHRVEFSLHILMKSLKIETPHLLNKVRRPRQPHMPLSYRPLLNPPRIPGLPSLLRGLSLSPPPRPPLAADPPHKGEGEAGRGRRGAAGRALIRRFRNENL